VDSMLRVTPRIMRTAGIPPATPLPARARAGGFASLPYDSFAKRPLYCSRAKTASRQLQTVAVVMFRQKACGVKVVGSEWLVAKCYLGLLCPVPYVLWPARGF
jgi:hypothetical protein